MKKMVCLLMVTALLLAWMPLTGVAEGATGRDALRALGFDIEFVIEEHEETLEDGFEYPISVVEVVLLYDGEPTDCRTMIAGLFGSVYEYDEEALSETYNPPENAIAGVQAYYAGAGDQIFVSYDPLGGMVMVWYRMFGEVSPNIDWEDCFDEWVEMDSYALAGLIE